MDLDGTQFSTVAQSYPTFWDPMDCSMPGFPVHHQLLELAQTHVHWVGDAIQPSHLLSSSSPPALNLSQNQGLFQWVSYLQSGGQSIGASASASALSTRWFRTLAFQVLSKSGGIVYPVDDSCLDFTLRFTTGKTPALPVALSSIPPFHWLHILGSWENSNLAALFTLSSMGSAYKWRLGPEMSAKRE